MENYIIKNFLTMKTKENKPHIAIYGRRNVGKSSLINHLSGQDVAIVADYKGTTTDPVKRSFEILGFGPVILIDTAGIDDEGEIGQLRVGKTLKTIREIDLAILVISDNFFGKEEEEFIELLKKDAVPFFILHNKSDNIKLSDELKNILSEKYNCPVIDFSVKNKENLEEIFDIIKNIIPESSWQISSMLGGIVNRGDIVLLITPIDTEAPAGRMILPQVQVIRDVMDNNCVAIVLKESELEDFLKENKLKIRLAITDSQMFGKVSKIIPEEIQLTGFSVLLARYKGDFKNYLLGTPKVKELKDGDKVLILESCSHHVSCEDIGRYKIPNWLTQFTRKKLEFKVVAGLDPLPENIKDYSLVIQCGGCVLTRKQVIARVKPAVDAGVPVTNYGMLIAYVHGIFDRAIQPFMEYE